MKFKELKKLYNYEEASKTFIVDVQLKDYNDAYSDWDYSPFVNRDLDQDLTEYLLECSGEIPNKYKLVIKFHILNHKFDPTREQKNIIGMGNYFNYQLRKIRNHRMRILRDIITFLIIGSILLLIGFFLSGLLSESLLIDVLSEGFFIGGWVMIWEMFSAWFFVMKKVRVKHRHFERLNQATIIYSYGWGDNIGSIKTDF